MEEIPRELVLKWDQTGIRLVPSSTWTMERKGERRVEMVGVNDKRQITAIFCGNAMGDFLPIQLIYKGKTPRCHPRFKFPTDFNVTHSRNHWSNEDTMIEYIGNIILPYVACVRERLNTDSAALVIMDNFKGQATPKVIQYLQDNNILISWLPPNTTDRLQPMDLSVNKPAKVYLKNKFDEWYSEMVTQQLEGKDIEDLEDLELTPVDLGMPVLKEISAKWFVEMFQYMSENPQFIVNGFVHSGISSAIDGVIDMGSTESKGISDTDDTTDEGSEETSDIDDDTVTSSKRDLEDTSDDDDE
ncbi:PREDICTED: uncharacterized protein LOC105316064 [Amphimedon queenslandica]|uniref:DDE-1 domain-containing protein n=1 Tax=Amphimedon queenslandica TaxID=400682 RepID=A0A1X7SMN9_AMPQE|nr:PREDICTED: uncharacterized protein LOC105316064 [Amphimedon queenslandica]|eukprot:XP_011409166.1 PREDICTED: uncharacterized protein LOC105316064 [Amphimedon queenslandica]